MKKIIYSLLVLAMAAFTFSSCEDVPAPYDMPTKPETPELSTDGTEANPYTVADAKIAATGTNVFVKAFIVGYVPDKALNEAIFSDAASAEKAPTNILIAASADETNVTNCMPIQLPAGAIRTALNLKDNPGNLKQEVILCGNIENYFGATGLKSVAYAKIGAKEFGTKPGGSTTTPDTPTDGYINETFNKSFGTFTLKNIKGTPWVIDSYGYAKATGYENTSKVTTPSESYLVSKAIDLSSSKGAALKFSYILRYATYNGEPTEGVKNQILITENYTGDPATTKWTNITGTLTEGTDWKTWSTYTYDLTPYKGKKNIVIALHYACEAKSGTWEIKELTVKEGTPTVKPETPDTPSTTEGISVNGLTVTLTNSGATTGESLKVEDLSTLKLDANPTEFTLSDGTIFKLDSNGNKTMPAYNEKAKELRIYANNIMTITGSKNIAKIILTCTHDNNKNTDCVGNETATIKFSGKTATYTNVFTGTTGGGVQLRIKSIEIVYAK